MTILFISLLAERIVVQRAENQLHHEKLREEIAAATSPTSAPSPFAGEPIPDKVYPHTDPYTYAEGARIYEAAVGAMDAIFKSRELDPSKDGGAEDEAHWLVERINGIAIRIGRALELPIGKLLAHLSDASSMVLKHPVRGFNRSHDAWTIEEAHCYERLLYAVCSMGQAMEATADLMRDIHRSGPTPQPIVAPETKDTVFNRYNSGDRNLIYAKAINLAAACISIRPGTGRDNSGETLALANAIKDRVCFVVRNLPEATGKSIAAALDAIRDAVMSTPVGGAIVTDSAELECIGRFLTMLLTGEARQLDVAIKDDCVSVTMPTGSTWDVELSRITNPGVLLKFVKDLSRKTWVTRDMIGKFVLLVCESKGWEGYDLSPEHNQEGATN